MLLGIYNRNRIAALAVGLLAGPLASGAFAQTAQLHVIDADHPQILVERTGVGEKMLFKLQNNGKVRFALINGANTWTFDNSGALGFTISKVGTGMNELAVSNTGDLTVLGTSFAQNHVNTSSRAQKESFEAIDESEVLNKLVSLPVLEWQYKTDETGARHIGPVAEDFHDAFGVSDSEHISTVDASGVTIAAIKGLHKLVQEKDDEIAELRDANEALGVRLARLETALQSQQH